MLWKLLVCFVYKSYWLIHNYENQSGIFNHNHSAAFRVIDIDWKRFDNWFICMFIKIFNIHLWINENFTNWNPSGIHSFTTFLIKETNFTSLRSFCYSSRISTVTVHISVEYSDKNYLRVNVILKQVSLHRICRNDLNKQPLACQKSYWGKQWITSIRSNVSEINKHLFRSKVNPFENRCWDLQKNCSLSRLDLMFLSFCNNLS